MGALAPIIVGALVQYGPELTIRIIQLLSKPNATDADWDALAAQYRGKKYEDYVKPGCDGDACVMPAKV